ncbi:MAG: UDP-glucose 4-epimerase [Frankiales bacterium]|nr:UDP-glucose 4-epimerase [Frankiales bacterium]
MAITRWLVTGGAGYIGAHVVRALLDSGRDAIVLDDLSTGLTSRLPVGVELLKGSVTDASFVVEAVEQTGCAGIIHLAAKKSPTESMVDPLLYADENVGGMMTLLRAVKGTASARIVFSSSCSVYGNPDLSQVTEDAPTAPASPYGDSKLYGERLLNSAATAYGFGAISLRYFNVVGAGAPALRDNGAYNLVPLAFQALRRGADPRVFGSDYPTPDGTCIRDYVDVEDLADAHVRAAQALEANPIVSVFNVGRGVGSSVLDVLDAIQEVTGLAFTPQILERRAGDPARIVGQVDKIRHELGWSARRTLMDMIGSAWLAELPQV